MKLPNTIKFGSMDIDVIYEEGLVKGQDVGGAVRPKLQTIHIPKSYVFKEQARRLFDMIHFFVSMLADNNADETRNRQIAAAMYATVRDNPILAEEFVAEDLLGKTLRILGRDFEICKEPEHWQYDGYTWATEWKIVYNAACKPQYNRDTIIHEVYHAIQISLDLECTEGEISRMAFAYCLIVHQNDLSWLFHEVDEDDTAKP